MELKINKQYFCEGCRTHHNGAPYLTYSYYGTVKNYCDKFIFPNPTTTMTGYDYIQINQ